MTDDGDDDWSIRGPVSSGNEERGIWPREDDLDEQKWRLAEGFWQWAEPVHEVIVGMQKLVIRATLRRIKRCRSKSLAEDI